MDWIRTHFLSYSPINGTNSSMSSRISIRTRAAPKSRKIRINSSTQPQKYCDNRISTCKYNALTFLPRFLIEQFRRYSNIFFLCTALFQQIPDVSPTGKFTTAVPLFIIMSISAIKEIFEDIKRRRMDVRVNNYKCHVLHEDSFQFSKWKGLMVGQIVKVYEGHNFPADIVILSSSEELGIAYIETAQLDGETNLKIRQALPCTANLITPEQLSKINAEIECEKPNQKVNEFTGTMSIGNDKFPLSITQLLLRGAKLKNCKWVCGVVIYTGHDSRLLMNSTTAPLKTSRIDTLTNRRVLYLFLLLLLITIISVVGAELYKNVFLTNAFYVEKFKPLLFFWNLVTFFILYNNIIPISLQVTLEVIRFFQAWYINQDLRMYDPESDTPATARTSNLNEELGQVRYLMTDKTGTLTRNVMKFKRCQIGGVEYGDDEKDEFEDMNILRDLTDGKGNSHLINEFLTMMASCHTVVPERKEEGEINFQSTSPDEGALVRGAAKFSYIFNARKPTEITIETPNGQETFELLNILEFTSDRKRMSVILRDQHNNIKLYCKGADNVIFARLSRDANSQEALDAAQQSIDAYAHKGYRTLCFAMTELSENDYQNWSHEFKEASTSLENRDEKLAEAAEKMERDLRLIGVTAIEDKLQENVPQTIKILLDAGIRIWMLTGDKLETAVQIAQSSSICSKDTELLRLTEKSYDAVRDKLNLFKNKSQQYLASKNEFALVIDGASLHHAVIGEAKRIFAELIVLCHSVICCRMTPMQKAEVVEIVKKLSGNSTVLAVGDGANDVAMIQAANIGVGITGEEGLQAASASDYSIAQFQFLTRLILIHGTWNYERTVKVILYSFYKNICLYIIELWFAFFSAFSGVTIFERWSIAMFNVAFTAWPPIILGLFDRPISQKQILAHPELYQSFQKMAFTNYRFAQWIIVSLGHSLIMFFLYYFIYGHGILWETGREGGWLMFGNSLYSCVVATICLKALLECDSWMWAMIGMIAGSILGWFLFLAVYSVIWPTIPIGPEMYGMFKLMVTSAYFWISFLFIPIVTLLPDLIIKSFVTTLSPSPREKLCLKEKSKTVGCHITDGAYEEVRQPYSVRLPLQQDDRSRQHLLIIPIDGRNNNNIPTPVNNHTSSSPPTTSQSCCKNSVINSNKPSSSSVNYNKNSESISIIPNPNYSPETYGALNYRNNEETIFEEEAHHF